MSKQQSAVYGIKIDDLTGGSLSAPPKDYNYSRYWLLIAAIFEIKERLHFSVTRPNSLLWCLQGNRMWRKTRKPNSGGGYGTDPNRNWNYKWAGS